MRRREREPHTPATRLNSTRSALPNTSPPKGRGTTDTSSTIFMFFKKWKFPKRPCCLSPLFLSLKALQWECDWKNWIRFSRKFCGKRRNSEVTEKQRSVLKKQGEKKTQSTWLLKRVLFSPHTFLFLLSVTCSFSLSLLPLSSFSLNSTIRLWLLSASDLQRKRNINSETYSWVVVWWLWISKSEVLSEFFLSCELWCDYIALVLVELFDFRLCFESFFRWWLDLWSGVLSLDWIRFYWMWSNSVTSGFC